MTETFIRKLGCFAALSPDDKAALRDLARMAHQVAPRVDIQREGEMHDHVNLVLDGLAARYKALPSGSRQIVAYLVPGDLCDVFGFILRTADHSITTLTSSTVAMLSPAAILAVTEAHPAVARALWWSSLVDEATLREWLLNVGRRAADQRIAHLLCELLVRLQVVGCATDNSFAFPVTQQDLAETTGLSVVHVNRMLQYLRGEGLIVLRSQSVTIPDVAKLKEFCGFRANYLHLERVEAAAASSAA